MVETIIVVHNSDVRSSHQDPWIFTNWLHEMDQFFGQMGLFDNKDRFGRMKLIGKTGDYWYGIEPSPWKGQQAITYWEEMKEELIG